MNSHGITSEQIPFGNLEGCKQAKQGIEAAFRDKPIVATRTPWVMCHCIDVDQ